MNTAAVITDRQNTATAIIIIMTAIGTMTMMATGIADTTTVIDSGRGGL